MAQDVTHIVRGLASRQLFPGITFERLILLLYPLLLIPVIFLWYHDLRRRRFSIPVPLGCRKLGLQGSSNTADEFDTKYDRGTTDATTWRVKALYVHPIKSCGAIELDIADLDAEGFTYDRIFAFAELLPSTGGDQRPQWKFRTLRAPGYEKLALVKPEVWVPAATNVKNAASYRRVEQEGALIIRYPYVPSGAFASFDRLMLRWGLLPEHNSFQLPLNPGKDHSYPREQVEIWGATPTWLNMRTHIPNDFKEWLGAKNDIAIFRAEPDSYREVFQCAPRQEQVGFQPAIGFQDSYPLHLLNISSVHDVAEKVGASIERLSIRRFRPNILMEGPPAYNEDDWKYVKIGDHEFYCACRTTRCKLPNVDPDTGVRHSNDPDKTLRSFRCIDEGNELAACLGMQVVPAKAGRCQIRVGDGIEVLQRGQHRYVKRGA